MRKENLPNAITVSRLLVVPFGVYVHHTLRNGDVPGALPLLVLVWLIGSDYLDGILARRWHAESDFGRFLDPAVDKTFLVTMLIVYGAAVDKASFWAVVGLRLLPDVMTFILSLVEVRAKKIKGSAFWGKRKTDTDFVALLIGYTPLLLSGETASSAMVGATLTVSSVFGFVAFGYYVRRLLTSRSNPVR